VISWDERVELRKRIRAVVDNDSLHPECLAEFVESLVHEFSDGEHEMQKVREKVKKYIADMRNA
jgi:DNA polymerase IIIc chi subunit